MVWVSEVPVAHQPSAPPPFPPGTPTGIHSQEASNDGVLGGFGHLSDPDIRDSRALLLKVGCLPSWLAGWVGWLLLGGYCWGWALQLAAMLLAAGCGRSAAVLLLLSCGQWGAMHMAPSHALVLVIHTTGALRPCLLRPQPVQNLTHSAQQQATHIAQQQAARRPASHSPIPYSRLPPLSLPPCRQCAAS